MNDFSSVLDTLSFEDNSSFVDSSLADSSLEISENSITDSSVSDEDRTLVYVSKQLDKVNEHLEMISAGVNYIFVCALFLIAFKGVWNVLNHWYFGGV